MTLTWSYVEAVARWVDRDIGLVGSIKLPICTVDDTRSREYSLQRQQWEEEIIHWLPSPVTHKSLHLNEGPRGAPPPRSHPHYSVRRMMQICWLWEQVFPFTLSHKIIQQNVWFPNEVAGEPHRVHVWIFWCIPSKVTITPGLWKTQTFHFKQMYLKSQQNVHIMYTCIHYVFFIYI